MKKIIFILLLFISYFSKAQTKDIYTEKTDSIVVKTYSYYDKETSTINDTIEKNNIILLNSRKLSQKEIIALNTKMKSKKSYSKNRALLSHSDLEIIYYNKNKIVQSIKFSTITKNLTIFKLNNCVFIGQATKCLDKEIIKILNK